MSSSPASPVAPANRWRVLTVISAALLIVVIDVTVLHIATPAISADLEPSAVGLLWIVDIYPLVVAPLLVLSASLSDRFGRKRVLLIGLVWFCLASVLAAFAWTTAVLTLARALQGIGGALIMPATMGIIREVFPDREERVKAVGIWSAVMAGGAAAGPLLGGLLLEHFWWGSVFLINVPVLLLVLPFAIRLLPESRVSDPPPRDVLGVALVGFGVLLLAFGIKDGSRHGFLTPIPAGALVLSVGLLWAFVRRQLSRPQPVLDLRLFKVPAFAVAVAAVLLSMFALVGLELFFAQYLQLVLGHGPLQASLRLIPLLASTLVGALAAAAVLGRLGTRTTITGGFLATGLALIPLLALGTSENYLLLWPPFLVLGAALEVALVAANDVIFASVSVEGAGQASAIEETAYELGGGLGVAVLGSIIAAAFTADLARLAGVPGAAMDQARESLPEALKVAGELGGPAATQLSQLARESFMHGFHLAIAVSVVVMLVTAALTARVLRDEPAAADGTQ